MSHATDTRRRRRRASCSTSHHRDTIRSIRHSRRSSYRRRGECSRTREPACTESTRCSDGSAWADTCASVSSDKEEVNHRCTPVRGSFSHLLFCLPCMLPVFPPLGCSLYDFLRANHFRPFFPHSIRHIAEQLLTTCAGLHQIGVVHADIKPENILFVDASYTTVQIQNLTVNVPLCTDIRMVQRHTTNTQRQCRRIVIRTDCLTHSRSSSFLCVHFRSTSARPCSTTTRSR